MGVALELNPESAYEIPGLDRLCAFVESRRAPRLAQCRGGFASRVAALGDGERREAGWARRAEAEADAMRTLCPSGYILEGELAAQSRLEAQRGAAVAKEAELAAKLRAAARAEVAAASGGAASARPGAPPVAACAGASGSGGGDHAAVRIQSDGAQLVRADDGRSWCKPKGRPRKGCVWDKMSGEWVLVVGPCDTSRKMARLLGESLNPHPTAAAGAGAADAAAERGAAAPRATATTAAAAAAAAAGGGAAAAGSGALVSGTRSAKRMRSAARVRSAANRKRINYMRSIEAVLGGCFSHEGLLTMQLMRAELPAKVNPALRTTQLSHGSEANETTVVLPAEEESRDGDSSGAAVGASSRTAAAAATAPTPSALRSATPSRAVASNARLLLHPPLHISVALLPTTVKGARPHSRYTRSEDLVLAFGVFQHTQRCGFDLRKTLGIDLTEAAVQWRLKNLRKQAHRPNHYTAFLEERRARAMTCEPYGEDQVRVQPQSGASAVEGGGGGALVGEARAKEMRKVLALGSARGELKARGFDLAVKPSRFAMQVRSSFLLFPLISFVCSYILFVTQSFFSSIRASRCSAHRGTATSSTRSKKESERESPRARALRLLRAFATDIHTVLSPPSSHISYFIPFQVRPPLERHQ